MTLRVRITGLASLAVAIVLVSASLVVYYSYRHDLMQQVDSELGSSLALEPLKDVVSFDSTGQTVVGAATRPKVKPSSTFKVFLPGSSTTLLVHMTRAVTASVPTAVTPTPVHYQTVTEHGGPIRQMTVLAGSSLVTVSLPLAQVDQSLSHLRWLLIFTCLGGSAVAILLSTLLSGRAISPLRRLTETTERIAATGELSARTGQRGRDEISRLSTQLDALLASLERSHRMQRQLVANASHELRTPLATLRVNVGLLARPDGLDAHERTELVADVEEELESMTSLVGELVELAQGEEQDIEPTAFRLDDVVRSAVARAAKRTQTVAFRTDLQPTTIVGAPEHVERAIDNLLDNARKWSPAGEPIDVCVRDGVVEVRDRGPGIAPEDQPLVFDRFYRSVNARGTPGAGLGLAIVKQVADAHNGTVSVDQAPDGGAIVRLVLSPIR